MSADRQTGKRFPPVRMTSYLSLSAAGVLATNAAAEVLHIPEQNLPIEVVNDQQLFLRFSIRNPGVENNFDYTFSPSSAYGGTFLLDHGTVGGVNQLLVSEAVIEFDAGTSVGPGTNINAELGDLPDLFWGNGYPLNPEDFRGPGNFLPVRFPTEDDFHYGFIEIEITPEGDLRILDAAWEDQLGVPITTPAGIDDAALSALAGGDEAVDSLRRKD